MPSPRSGESHTEFMERCMGDEVMVREFPDAPQRVAVCESQWKDAKLMERRTVELKQLVLAQAEDGPGSFSGYASTWDLDQGGDIIKQGAFKEALPAFLERGFVPLSHDWLGLPIATITEAKEDDAGLWLDATFHSTPAAQDARTVLAERKERGKFVGLSIGYLVDQEGASIDDETGIRTITKIAELAEVSIVAIPMNRAAQVTAVKGSLGAGRSFETHLDLVAGQVQLLVQRSQERLAYRAKEGRVLSAANRERLAGIRTSLGRATADLDDILKATAPDSGKADSDWLRARFRRNDLDIWLVEQGEYTDGQDISHAEG